MPVTYLALLHDPDLGLYCSQTVAPLVTGTSQTPGAPY